MSVEQLSSYGEIKKETKTIEVEENNFDGTYVSNYTGHWHLEWNKEKETGKRVRQGQGKLERKNGEVYEGYFLSNKFHGKGTLTFGKDDSKGRKEYAGNFKVGLMHGCGHLFWSNGDSCVGIWHFGQLKKGEGVATYIWADGTKTLVNVDLQGDIRFPSNLTLYYPNNDFREVYHGEVNDSGIPHGKGKMVLKNGKSIEGDWINGLNTNLEPKLE